MTKSRVYLARNGVIGRPFMPTTTSPLTIPRSGFVHPAFPRFYGSDVLQFGRQRRAENSVCGLVRRRRNVRRLVHGSFLIVYRILESNRLIEILRFWHGGRGAEIALAVG
jgi:hypothetical protein